MFDCHIHAALDGKDWRGAFGRHQRDDEQELREMLRTYRQAGFVYLRDGGDKWGAGLRARALAPEYGIAYRTPVTPLCRKGHYGGFIGECYEDMAQYRALVGKVRDLGGDFIKIMVSGLMDFDRFGVLTEEPLPEAEIRELVAVAHGEGFAVMAHANGARCMEAAARAGADSIEHGAYPDQRALEAMGEMGSIWVPTLSTVGNLRGRGRFDEGAVERILAGAMENVAEFAAMGGLLAPGTDAGAWAVPHGSRTEYALLGQAVGPEQLEKGARELRRRF